MLDLGPTLAVVCGCNDHGTTKIVEPIEQRPAQEQEGHSTTAILHTAVRRQEQDLKESHIARLSEHLSISKVHGAWFFSSALGSLEFTHAKTTRVD